MTDFLPILLDGARITAGITGAAATLAVCLALASGLARLSRSALMRRGSAIYVELFRGTSLLVQLFWLFFVLPHFGVTLTPFQTAVLGLGLNIGAYGSEVVRGAILAVPSAQAASGAALGLTRFQVMRHVVLPQALLRMLPLWGNLLIELLKGTALVSLITVPDLAFRAYQLNQATFRTVEIFAMVLVIYGSLALLIVACTRGLERYLGRHRSERVRL
jgi:polar amino acid transport system permease protein